jgi:6-phosphogluconate dehydrogenase (decarboxylating)
MQIGVIALGRMGSNIVRRRLRPGHACARNEFGGDVEPGKRT